MIVEIIQEMLDDHSQTNFKMKKKIQVALIYRPCQTLSKNNYYTHVNNFFMYALKRNEQISITYWCL